MNARPPQNRKSEAERNKCESEICGGMLRTITAGYLITYNSVIVSSCSDPARAHWPMISKAMDSTR